MPSPPLIDAAQNVTVLIHEATMDNDQVEMAAAKAHSTVGQALDVAQRYISSLPPQYSVTDLSS